MLTRLDLCDEELVGSLEELVDIDGEIPIRIDEHEEVQELRVVQEEETRELQPLFFQILVGLLLKLGIEADEPSEDGHSLLDHQVVYGFRVAVGTPHYATELRSRIEETCRLWSE